MALVSPGVQVTVTDESFFIPVAAPTVPLLFIATADEKTQTDGQTPAEGTYEHSVVRTITSLKQSLDTYGLPNFLSTNNEQHHGDARNEYGLLALNQFLGLGNRAYVVRANVNLNDDIDSIRELWDGTNNATLSDPGGKMQEAKTILENLILEFINNYNTANNLISGSDSLLAGQTEADFSGAFVGGLGAPATGYAVGDLITLTNSAVVTVDNVDANGDVTEFTVTTAGPASDGVTLNQLSTTNTGDGFSLTPGLANLVQFKTTVDGAELLSLMKDATQFIFDPVIGSYSFIPLETEFFADLSATPLDVFANGYGATATGTYPGAEAVTTNPSAYSYAPTATVGEWTAQEGGVLLTALANDFKFTQVFLNKTSLGLNDAARRVAITTALQAIIESNTDVRSENFDFNLVLCPGYPETVDNLLRLVNDIQDEALVIGDTPMDRSPDGITNPQSGWAVTQEKVSSNHVAYYYPHCLTTNLDGRNVLGAASGVALRQFAFSDSVSFLWFAPAGVRRGIVSGTVSDVGYVTGELGGPTEFNPIALNNGQRDALYQYSASGMINPIVFFPGRGLIIFGQKTSLNVASALDRVNVSRLVKYIKRQLRRNTLPFIFEPNDQITRDNLKAAVDNFLGDLIIKRGLFDFASVCDESNNTPDRIDRNEMYIDVAIKPVKAAEFLFIPLRVVATGAEI